MRVAALLPWRRRWVVPALGLLLWVAPAAARPSETAVKAAFLTRFAAYVDWPANLRLPPTAPMIVCVVGSDPFGRTIDDAVRGQQVDRHPLALKRLPDAAGAESCQIAFVAGTSDQATADMLRAFQGKPVLTVTDGRAGPQRGMVHFVVDRGRIRFHVDRAAAESVGLNLNARLLAIALSVRTNR
ncbi:MAG: hypothetical protein QOH81_911 [Sphingomonadales bacterium]|jgi:hypothetical protein|nr:hypothetical protein [Sphingomonadales bacterium]